MVSANGYKLLKYIQSSVFLEDEKEKRSEAASDKSIKKFVSDLGLDANLLSDLVKSGCVYPIDAKSLGYRITDIGRVEIEAVESAARENRRAEATMIIAVVALISSVADIILRLFGVL